MFPIGFLSGLKVYEIRVGKDVRLVVSGEDWLKPGTEAEVIFEGPCLFTDSGRAAHRIELSKPDSIPPLFRLRSRVIATAFAEGGNFRAIFDDGSSLTVPPEVTNVQFAWRAFGPGGELGLSSATVVCMPGGELHVRNEWFELALAQTIAWCAPRADPHDPANSLRSTGLRPKVLGNDRQLEVSGVVASRRHCDPAVEAATEVQTAADLQGGRLLVYFPDEELSDGAAEAESAGFFDVFNAPPWDTWVAWLDDDRSGAARRYSGPYLVSWVPPSFLDLAAAGIFVNPEECIRWLEDTDVPIRARLRERGVIT